MKKRDIAGELVAKHGKFVQTAPDKFYYIRLGSYSFHSNDTADLADQVAKKFTKLELEGFNV